MNLTLDDAVVLAFSIIVLISLIKTQLKFVAKAKRHNHDGRYSPMVFCTIFGVFYTKGTPRSAILHEWVHQVMLVPYFTTFVRSFGWIPIKMIWGIPPMSSFLIAMALTYVSIPICEIIADTVCTVIYGKSYWRNMARMILENLGLYDDKVMLYDRLIYPHRYFFMKDLMRRHRARLKRSMHVVLNPSDFITKGLNDEGLISDSSPSE